MLSALLGAWQNSFSSQDDDHDETGYGHRSRGGLLPQDNPYQPYQPYWPGAQQPPPGPCSPPLGTSQSYVLPSSPTQPPMTPGEAVAWPRGPQSQPYAVGPQARPPSHGAHVQQQQQQQQPQQLHERQAAAPPSGFWPNLFGHKEANPQAAHGADPHFELHVPLRYSLGAPRHEQPRRHALCLEGVRVFECARRAWTTALCGQLLAANGADVVRVHVPVMGANGKEAAPVVPDFFHISKRLAPLKVNVPEDLARIQREVLPVSDIFLTDLPVDELQSLGLDYSRMSTALPHVIYAIVSCIGPLADVQFKGVEDAGAFFSLSGLAEEVGPRLGPRGFAAATGASALFGVLCVAMLRRRSGAKGDRVMLSLTRAGRWCATLGLLTNFVSPPTPPSAPPVPPEQVKRPPVMPFEVEAAAHLPPPPHPRIVGQFLYRWREPDAVAPPPSMFSPLGEEAALSRLSVVEVSDEFLISAAALGRLLVDLGAFVTKVERPQRPDPWKKNCPALYEALNRGKKVETLNYSHLSGEAAMYKALAEASVLITNLPAHALEQWGFGLGFLRTAFPHLVIVLITTWGCDRAGVVRDLAEQENLAGHEIDAFWEASGLSNHAFGDRAMPPGLSELAIAQHALAGLGLALLRQQVTKEGQLVHIGRYQAGLFSRMLCEVVQTHPCESQLLETKDSRFVRLLGRGHNPHEVWMLLHAVGKREGMLEKAKGVLRLPSDALHGHTWESVERHHQELVEGARHWRYDDLAQAFRERGIDWFVEELRPRQAAMLHQRRMEIAQAHGGSDMHRQLSMQHAQHQQQVQAMEMDFSSKQQQRDQRRRQRRGRDVSRSADSRGSDGSGRDYRGGSPPQSPRSPRSPRSPMSPGSTRTEEEYRRALRELEEAKEMRDKTGVQVRELNSMMDLAQGADMWLKDAKVNAFVPWSIEDKAWREALGGHLLLTPPCWLAIPPTAGKKHNKAISLFAAAPPKPVLQVAIVSASNLRFGQWTNQITTYARCEIPSKPHSVFVTKAVGENSHHYHSGASEDRDRQPAQQVDPLNPVWNEETLVADYAAGDPLIFTVVECRSHGGRDDRPIGMVKMKPGEFYPQGFDGPVNLEHDGDMLNAVLNLRITVGMQQASVVARPVIELHLVGARGLRPSGWQGETNPYCVITVPVKPHLRWVAPTIPATTAPLWNFHFGTKEVDVQDEVTSGDAFEFSVYDKAEQSNRRDELLGRAELPSRLFYPQGFDSELLLEDSVRGTEAYIGLKVKVKDRHPVRSRRDRLQHPDFANDRQGERGERSHHHHHHHHSSSHHQARGGGGYGRQESFASSYSSSRR